MRFTTSVDGIIDVWMIENTQKTGKRERKDHAGLSDWPKWPVQNNFGICVVASPIAMLAYGVSHVQDSIWKGLSWSITVKFIVDGVIYGLVTGAIFGWLWPAV